MKAARFHVHLSSRGDKEYDFSSEVPDEFLGACNGCPEQVEKRLATATLRTNPKPKAQVKCRCVSSGTQWADAVVAVFVKGEVHTSINYTSCKRYKRHHGLPRNAT